MISAASPLFCMTVHLVNTSPLKNVIASNNCLACFTSQTLYLFAWPFFLMQLQMIHGFSIESNFIRLFRVVLQCTLSSSSVLLSLVSSFCLSGFSRALSFDLSTCIEICMAIYYILAIEFQSIHSFLKKYDNVSLLQARKFQSMQ